jgi:hypothetical protein
LHRRQRCRRRRRDSAYPLAPRSGPWLNRLVGAVLEWAGPLLIVAAVVFVQVRIDQAVTGAVHHVLVAASVLVEIAVLWRWEQWFSGRLGS